MGMSSLNHYLQYLILRLTDDCNLRCRYCYASGGRNKTTMPWPVAKKALDLAGASGLPFSVQLTGGEPLLAWDLAQEAITYCRSVGYHAFFKLQTNGTLISSRVARELRRLNIGVGISLDGPPNANEYLRPRADGGRSTQATITGMQNLAEEQVMVGVTAVITSKNIHHLHWLLDLSLYAGNIGGITFDILRKQGRAVADYDDLYPQSEDVREGLKKVVDHAAFLKSLGVKVPKLRHLEHIRYFKATDLPRSSYCYATTGKSLAITPDGSAYPCASLAEEKVFYLGNIMDPHFSPFRAYQAHPILKNNPRPAPCSTCGHSSFCGGGCLARNYAISPDLNQPDPAFCAMISTLSRF